MRDLFASDRWRSYLEFLAKFHRYSANNTIAIYLQRPTASLVASFSDWRRRGRKVRKGEHGIKILAPHTIKDVDDETGEISSASVSTLPTALTSAKLTARTCPKARRVN